MMLRHKEKKDGVGPLYFRLVGQKNGYREAVYRKLVFSAVVKFSDF